MHTDKWAFILGALHTSSTISLTLGANVNALILCINFSFFFSFDYIFNATVITCVGHMKEKHMNGRTDTKASPIRMVNAIE